MSLAVCSAGAPEGYLWEAGPAPIRFGPGPGSLAEAVLPPLLMKTPPPVDPTLITGPAAGARTSAANGAVAPGSREGSDSSRLEASGALSQQMFGTPKTIPVVNPYEDGIPAQPEGGWWRVLFTNKVGLVSVPIPAVDFTPPAVRAPASRATYTTAP